MELYERLQELRRARGFSQEELADRLGVSRQAVSKWENGQGKPELDNVVRLAEIYGVTTDYLLAGKAAPPAPGETAPPWRADRAFRRAAAVIAVIGATALITVLFISALFLLGNLAA